MMRIPVFNALHRILIATLTLAQGRFPAPEGLRLFVMVGFCGGYTTFSTASVEGVRLAAAGRWGAAAWHALGMIAACYAAAMLALLLGAALWAE